jgi:hypothetical protein
MALVMPIPQLQMPTPYLHDAATNTNKVIRRRCRNSNKSSKSNCAISVIFLLKNKAK